MSVFALTSRTGRLTDAPLWAEILEPDEMPDPALVKKQAPRREKASDATVEYARAIVDALKYSMDQPRDEHGRWSDAWASVIASGYSADTALAAIPTLHEFTGDGRQRAEHYVDNPLHPTDDSGANVASSWLHEHYGQSMHWDRRLVNVSEVASLQKYLDADLLKSYAPKMEEILKHEQAAAFGFEHGGKVWLQDGNHRANLLALGGAKTIPVVIRVLDEKAKSIDETWEDVPHGFTPSPVLTDTPRTKYSPDQPRVPAGSPDGGQFGSSGAADAGTDVGVTSSRPGRQSREVFHQMHEFEGQLSALPGVHDVSVQPGLGAWNGGHEPTWVVHYVGNGEATRLLAETGKKYDQDAILVMRSGGSDPATEFNFASAVGSKLREAIGDKLIAHGIGGWTWYKSGGHTVLRAVSVPAWGSTASAHEQASREISQGLTQMSITHAMSIGYVTSEVMERSGDHSYDSVLGEKK